MFHSIPSRRTLGATLVLALALWPVPASAGATVHVDNLSYEADRHSVVLAISGPVTITTRSLRAPARLVVDLPATTLMSKNRELVIGDKLVKRVRISQFKIIPPTVRVVIETVGDEEPVIAVQQTAKHLYITVAAPGDLNDDHDDHQHQAPTPPATAMPLPAPTAIAPSPILPSPIAPSPIVPSPIAPSPIVTSPRPTPSPLPSPLALPSPVIRPSAAPTPRPIPSPLPTPRRGDVGGEAGNESMPGVGE